MSEAVHDAPRDPQEKAIEPTPAVVAARRGGKPPVSVERAVKVPPENRVERR